jgi:hypothetical protein
MYREVVAAAKSLYRIIYPLPSLWLAFRLGRVSGIFTEKVVETMGIDGRDFRHRCRTDLDYGVILFCLSSRVYLKLRRSGRTDVVGIRYEDLVKNPTESISRIFKHCRLPDELVEPGLRGMKVDSQRNSVIAKQIIGSIPEPELTPETMLWGNDLLRKDELPLIGDECLIEGTITYDGNERIA